MGHFMQIFVPIKEIAKFRINSTASKADPIRPVSSRNSANLAQQDTKGIEGH